MKTLTQLVKSRPGNAAGFFIHSELHKARPDVHAICHAHTIAGRAWTAFGKPLDMVTQDVCNFYNVQAVYNNYGGLVLGAEEGKKIARAMGAHNKVFYLVLSLSYMSCNNLLPHS